MKAYAIAVMVAASALVHGPVAAQSTLDVDEKRVEEQKELGVGIPDPDAIRKMATELFAKPYAQQNEQDLKNLAQQANRYANMVGYLEVEYNSYYRDNYRYEFVQKKVGPVLDAYTDVSNEFKGYRNLAYYNLGLLAKDAGDGVAALLYFRDAFRLSTFDCGTDGANKCMRWLAEQEIQKLLGLGEMRAYVTWQ